MRHPFAKMYTLGLILLFAGACFGAPNNRVIGGQDAAIGEVPTIVSLRSSFTNRHFCGGSVLNENWVLTAAHCILGSSPSSIIVVSGTNTLNAGGNVNRVSRVITHSGFDYQDLENDIGLLQLSSPIQLSNLVQPIVLPEANRQQGAGLPVLAVGWGVTSYPGGSAPNNLQKLNLNVVSNGQCQTAHGAVNDYLVYDSNVCAGSERGRSVCHGDSGSPLLEAGSNVIVGIVSWGEPCATGVPDVYTRVSSFLDWIADNAQ